jgi:membrane-anchored mycosin MYCP
MPTDQQEIRIEAHEDQLVVGLSQAEQVLEILAKIPVSWSSVEKNSALKLALLTVDSLTVPEGFTDESKAGLDLLISYLRTTFRNKYGSDLTIGKNRIVGSITGSPYTGGGIKRPLPYTGGGIKRPLPYTGGGINHPLPYTGGGENSPAPDTGNASQGIQPASGNTLPKRKESPGQGVRVGILDTRIFAHPDLAGRYLASHGTLASEDKDRLPGQDAHATFIAGVVLQRAPDADLIVDHVLDEDDIATSSWKVATRMVRFADDGVSVLNVSFGAATVDDQPPLVLARAVEVLTDKGVIVVAAAGNNGPSARPIWPAALTQAVAVGAGTVESSGAFKPAGFSPDAKWVDLMAPGEDIFSTYRSSGYATWNGTSFAAAAVSGAIAFLVQTQRISPTAAVDRLKTPLGARTPSSADAVIADIGP